MFSNATIYLIKDGSFNQKLDSAIELLSNDLFQPCEAGQEKSIGWVAPRDENGALIECIDGQWILCFKTEVKTIPASAITKELKLRIVNHENTTGCKPGKKRIREIKDEIKTDFMPRAFSKESRSFVWIDCKKQRIVIDTSTQSKADIIATSLVKCFDGLIFELSHHKTSPVQAMSQWLTIEQPYHFSVDRDCELKASDESKALVKYANHRLDIDEVAVHIKDGKLPTKLGMTWNDRISFQYSLNNSFKKINFLDLSKDKSNERDGFDADVLIFTSEFSALIDDLNLAFSGE